MSKSRNSSMELLRILSIFFIICSHFCVHGGFETREMVFSFNKLILQVGVLGNLGVVTFVMISGYFLSEKSFKLTRIVKVWLQVIFYSVSIYIIFLALNIIPFSIEEAIKAAFPVLFTQYWFASTYIVFSFIAPFLNILLNGFTKKQFILFLGILLFIWSILPTFTAQHMVGSELTQFIMFYSIGAFAKKYPDLPCVKKNRYWIACISASLLILSTMVFDLLAIYIPVFNRAGTYFYSRNSILIIVLSYGLILIFANMKNMSHRFINVISSTGLGIYLIHDNNYVRSVIWDDILCVTKYKYSPYLIIYLLTCVLVVFILCAVVDYLRQKIFEKPILHLIEPSLNRLTDKLLGKVYENT